MTAITALWLPILVSAVIVFIASSILHMAPLWHRSDYPRLENQDAVMEALRNLKVPPGMWFMPRSKDMAEMKTPEARTRLRVLEGTNDGFEIAEADLRLRGPDDDRNRQQQAQRAAAPLTTCG